MMRSKSKMLFILLWQRKATRLVRPFLRAWLCGIFVFIVMALAARAQPDSFYPIGIYAVNQTNDFTEIRTAGFNVISGHAEKSFLDAAHNAKLKVLASVGSLPGKEFSREIVQKTIQSYDTHPALWAWYLADEPDLHRISPNCIRSAHDYVKSLELAKPTALVVMEGAQSLYYANITDIMMIDRYPIPWLPLANFSKHVRMTRLALGKDKPMVAVIQAFDWSLYPPELLAAVDDWESL